MDQKKCLIKIRSWMLKITKAKLQILNKEKKWIEIALERENAKPL